MKTKTRKRGTVETGAEAPAPKPAITDNLQSPQSNETEKANRISFFLTPENTPDFSRMHGKTKTQLTELLRNKAVQKELGITPDEAKKIEEIGFGNDEANFLLDMLTGINSLAASRIYKVPREVTSQAFKFTEDHREKINPKLITILNKWSPVILKTWKDEIGLGMIFFSVLNAQVTLMHIMEGRRQRAAQVPPREKVTQMPSPAPAPEPLKENKEDKPAEEIATPIAETLGLNA